MKIDESATTEIIKRNLNLDPNFEQWFFCRITGDSATTVRCDANQNVSDTGEVDIRAEFQTERGTTALAFIENTIDALPTPRQFERYAERVQRERKLSTIDHVVACLVAPRAYIEAYEHCSQFFDVMIDYESVKTMLRSEDDRQALNAAIEKGTTSIPPDPLRTSWKERYFAIAREAWPGAKCATSTAQPLGDLMTYVVSAWPSFDFYQLNIEHHVWDERDRDVHNTIRVKLAFRDDNEKCRAFEVAKQHLAQDMQIEFKRKSKRVYVYTTKGVPEVRITRSPDDQAETIQRCALIAKELYAWVESLPNESSAKLPR